MTKQICGLNVEFLNVKQGVLFTTKGRCIRSKYQWHREK